MTGWESRPLLVPATHASAAGHFPGNPVIPGALLLDEAIEAMALSGPLGFSTVKFHAPARPGAALLLRWRREAPGSIRFEIRNTDRDETVAEGRLEVQAETEADG